jgi:hypothetical protein
VVTKSGSYSTIPVFAKLPKCYSLWMCEHVLWHRLSWSSVYSWHVLVLQICLVHHSRLIRHWRSWHQALDIHELNVMDSTTQQCCCPVVPHTQWAVLQPLCLQCLPFVNNSGCDSSSI